MENLSQYMEQGFEITGNNTCKPKHGLLAFCLKLSAYFPLISSKKGVHFSCTHLAA
jgi:hypothetical protein